jgi:hypothetical protein
METEMETEMEDNVDWNWSDFIKTQEIISQTIIHDETSGDNDDDEEFMPLPQVIWIKLYEISKSKDFESIGTHPEKVKHLFDFFHLIEKSKLTFKNFTRKLQVLNINLIITLISFMILLLF